MEISDPLSELISIAPACASEAQTRWRAACEAVAVAFPDRPGSARAPATYPRALRVAFDAVGLFVFQSTFLALFDWCGGAHWGWRLDHGDGPLDAWLTTHCDNEQVVFDGIEFTRESTSFEFVVNARALVRAFEPPRAGGYRFDDHDAGSPIEAIVGAIGRRMIHIAVIENHDVSDAAALEARLLEAFGSGPRMRG